MIGKGYLKFEDFKKFVNKYPDFKNIELSNYGEIFLNPELEEIIKYAYTKGISLTAWNGVNLNTLTEEMAECLAKYKFKGMRVSIDGATSETYKIYRKEGNFNKVIENIEKINRYKKRYGTEFPKLQWAFIMFGHNEHELPAARKMAGELKMEFRSTFNFEPPYSPVKDKELVRKEMGAATIVEYFQKTGKRYVDPCRQLWFSPQINWDGKLLGCCCNGWQGDFGNVFESSLEECLKSEKYLYAKKMLLGREKPKEDIPCNKCFRYKTMLSKGKFLSLFEGEKKYFKRVMLTIYVEFIGIARIIEKFLEKELRKVVNYNIRIRHRVKKSL